VKKRLDIIVIVAACVAIASWSLGFSVQGQPDYGGWANLAGVGFCVAIAVALVAIFLEIERRRRAVGQPKDSKRPD
jgi:hypothetical protein